MRHLFSRMGHAMNCLLRRNGIRAPCNNIPFYPIAWVPLVTLVAELDSHQIQEVCMRAPYPEVYGCGDKFVTAPVAFDLRREYPRAPRIYP
jgi:hypothetical protein